MLWNTKQLSILKENNRLNWYDMKTYVLYLSISVPTTDINKCSLVHFGQKRLVGRSIWNNNDPESHSYEWQYTFHGLFQIPLEARNLF